jgi:hypothetical protein
VLWSSIAELLSTSARQGLDVGLRTLHAAQGGAPLLGGDRGAESARKAPVGAPGDRADDPDIGDELLQGRRLYIGGAPCLLLRAQDGVGLASTSSRVASDPET